MSKLICDICGTSYSAGVHQCPTCGYSRAFEELETGEAAVSAVHKKVRGGRFSKRNVRRRLDMLEKSGRKGQEPADVELGEELRAAVASVLDVPEQMPPVGQDQYPAEGRDNVQEPETEPIVMVLSDEESAQEEMVCEEPVPAAPADEEAVAEEAPIVMALPAEEPAPAAPGDEEAVAGEAPIVMALPAEEPAPEAPGDEEAVAEEAPIVMALPAEEPAPEAPVAEEVPPVIVLPETADVQEESAAVSGEEPQEAEEEKKKKGGCLLNVVFYASVAVFLASAIYLIVMYGIPYLKNVDWPTRPAIETVMPTEEPTTAPTEAPTQAPTDAPTEAPTDPPTEPPTEAPTDPPTEPPTEAPTEPLLDVKLELNYYDLTFPKKGDVTQLKANVIPNEDITWISDDPGVVSISETGLITAVGGGRTTVRAIYGDQEVTVKINCRF